MTFFYSALTIGIIAKRRSTQHRSVNMGYSDGGTVRAVSQRPLLLLQVFVLFHWCHSMAATIPEQELGECTHLCNSLFEFNKRVGGVRIRVACD